MITLNTTRADRQRRARFREAGRSDGAPIHRTDAERLLYGPSFLLNNRLVIFLAFEPVLDSVGDWDRAFLRHEAYCELECIAARRVLPYGRPMRARTLYRLMCVENLLGSTDWNVAGRIALFRDHAPRSARPGHETTQLIKRFHRHASVLLSRGIAPTALLDELIGS